MDSCSSDVAPATENTDLDRLGNEIAELSAHLDAATAHLLHLIREFDVREGWNTGFRSCAAWLSWRVGLDPGAARERVCTARALGNLPRLSQSLARGEISFSKARAVTRVARPETEEQLLAVAEGRYRRARRADRSRVATGRPRGRGAGERRPPQEPCAPRVSGRRRHGGCAWTTRARIGRAAHAGAQCRARGAVSARSR